MLIVETYRLNTGFGLLAGGHFLMKVIAYPIVRLSMGIAISLLTPQ
jgi:hypothetical protein